MSHKGTRLVKIVYKMETDNKQGNRTILELAPLRLNLNVLNNTSLACWFHTSLALTTFSLEDRPRAKREGDD